MRRLNNRAFDILLKELDNCSTSDALSQAEKKIVLKRLEKLRLQDGSPASFEEIREAVVDLFPHFNNSVLPLPQIPINGIANYKALSAS